MEPLSAANTHFFLNLFKKISEGNPSGNVFYSPVSVSSALAMVLLGVKGNTADQMNKVLGFKNSPKPHSATPGPHVDEIHSSFKKFMSELNKPGVPYVLSLANRLYGEQSYQFVEKFLNDTKIYYEAGLEKVDFKTKSEAARVNINKWVEKKTQGRIKDVVPPGAVNGFTNAIVVNTMFFIGTWVTKFPVADTRDGLFKLNKNDTKPVKMMHQKAQFPLASIPEMNCQILELPYVRKNLSMLIILPNKIEDDTTGLQKLENALISKFSNWTSTSNMRQQEVEVSLPRFTMEESTDMNKILISMGMKNVFDPQKVNLSGMCPNKGLVVSNVIHKAFIEVNEEGISVADANINITVSIPFKTSDMNESLTSMGMEDVFDEKRVNLSGMSPNNDLVPSNVIHKPFVEVNEEGTEAAAATAIRNLNRIHPISPPRIFNADHPFLFFIRHNPSNAILFYGRFCSP